MRFRGGGIGHKAMWDALAKISKEFHGLFEEDGEDPMTGGSGLDQDHGDNAGDSDDDGDDEGEDSQAENSDDETDDEDGDEDVDGADLGPEDGEEAWEDVLDAEGYAPL